MVMSGFRVIMYHGPGSTAHDYQHFATGSDPLAAAVPVDPLPLFPTGLPLLLPAVRMFLELASRAQVAYWLPMLMSIDGKCPMAVHNGGTSPSHLGHLQVEPMNVTTKIYKNLPSAIDQGVEEVEAVKEKLRLKYDTLPRIPFGTSGGSQPRS